MSALDLKTIVLGDSSRKIRKDAKNISGQKFNRLTAVRPLGRIPRSGGIIWETLCDCGKSSKQTVSALIQGKTKSCGCLHSELTTKRLIKQNTTHGLAKTPEHCIWTGIIKRCYNKKCKAYNNYGGRGIGMCDEWRNDFPQFLKDMGPRPSPQHSIERIDNNKGYSKKNCRWATTAEQALNTRRNVRINYDGKNLTVLEWSRITGLKYATILRRVHAGCPTHKLFDKPRGK